VPTTGAATSERFDNAAKQLLEQLFGMSTGYVLDFNNGTFASFVQTCLGFDPYGRYEGSKAFILRQIWLKEPYADVARLNVDLLERWRINKLQTDEEPTKFEAYALDKLTGLFAPVGPGAFRPRTLHFSTKISREWT
jgi:hypothetical protein